MKAHVSEVCDVSLDLRAGTAGAVGYHGAANVNGDSLGSTTNRITQMQMANNDNVQALNDNISTITTETRDLHTTLATSQQQHNTNLRWC